MQRTEFRVRSSLFLLKAILPFTLCTLPSALCTASDSTPPRVFFSDAKISLEIPDHWNIGRQFPYGALFTHITASGTAAAILCAVSAPVDSAHMMSDVAATFLQNFAHADLSQRAPHAEILGEAERTIAARNAFDITWEDSTTLPTAQYDSVYFYNENRVYALTLKAEPSIYSDVLPDFHHAQDSLRFLSRQAHGQLDSPSHGGIWVHQTGGLRIRVPSDWLIGVADDRQMGAAIVAGNQHAEWTATVDPLVAGHPISDSDKKDARDNLKKEGFQITREGAQAFHDLPAYQFDYEGKRGDRFVKGEDLWVSAPQGRWLFNMEADGSLFNKIEERLQELWSGIQFLETPAK